MTSNKAIIHKLNYGGTLDDVTNIEYKGLFTLTSILSVYNKKTKTLYIWVGKNAPQSLRNHILDIRKILYEKDPENKILRNINLDSGMEPQEFFEILELDKNELKEQLDNLENKRLTIINDIDQLKINANNFFTLNKFDEAIDIAHEIIGLSEEINEQMIIDEQEDFIKYINEFRQDKEKAIKLENETHEIKKKFEEYIDNNQIFQAHKLIQGYYKNNRNLIESLNFKPSFDIIMEEREIWENFLVEQNAYLDKIKNLIQNIEESIEKDEFSEAKINLIEVKEEIQLISDDNIHLLTNEKKEFQEKAVYLEYKIDIEEALNQAATHMKQNLFDMALEIIGSTLERIKEVGLSNFEQVLQQKLHEMTEIKEDYDRNQRDLFEYIELFEKEKNLEHFIAAKKICQKIIEIARTIKKEELISNFQSELEKIIQTIQNKEEKAAKEIEELNKKAKEIENSIKVDENVLPLMEEFSVNELLGTVSDDLDEMFNQIGNLLNEHRVELKEEINNKTIIMSESGEVLELDKDLKVQEELTSEASKKLKVQSGLENPFEEYIEEAIIQDVIPFNFEIESIELNGEPIKEIQDKKLKKEGLEINWQLNNIAPKDKFAINYNLRRRVSRTIIFMLKNQLKIIKNHSNLSKLKEEGFYEARLPFTNNYEEHLEGVVVEDIIPLYYVHFINEPKNILPDSMVKSEMGDLIKWNVGQMDQETKSYNYRLLELYKYEEVKIDVSEMTNKATEQMNKGKLRGSIQLFQKIIEKLSNYIE